MLDTTAITNPKNLSVLNQGQEAAADGFFQFLFSEQKEMIISGPGGVGKTFLMGYLIDHIMPRYFQMCKLMGIKPEYDSIVMTATTNKAANVLSHSTGRPTDTIHSFLGIKPKEDYTTGRTRLVQTKNWKVHERLIIFVDECSMVDSLLYKLIHEGTQDCKIVFVGDHCQLAPVTETLSPIYRENLPFFELTEPMRNAGQPALIHACDQLRETVKTGIFHPIQVVPGVIDWVNDDEMASLIKQSFHTQTLDARILAYTNSRVVDYNEYIRGIRNLPPEYGAGEFLVNNHAIPLGRNMLAVEEEIEILAAVPGTRKITLPDNGELEVRDYQIRTRLGRYETVSLPVDRNHHSALLKYYQKQKNWPIYYQLKEQYPDLRPRDAATVHKAQGSTYDTVFIDLSNISTCNLSDVVARLLYVGFTRAKSRVVLYGDLAEKYGGVVS
jgi:hypothetical protein